MDILADLEGVPAKPPGKPCRITVMRRERPDLAEQFDKIILALRNGEATATHRTVADWFAMHGFVINEQMVGHHKQGGCSWCPL